MPHHALCCSCEAWCQITLDDAQFPLRIVPGLMDHRRNLASRECWYRINTPPHPRLEKTPHRGGYYQIALILKQPLPLTIGRLGRFHFKPGWYIYTGSAKRGVVARVKRHVTAKQKKHWHIDYLTRWARACAWRSVSHMGTTECALVEALLRAVPGSERFPRQFGASDCRCAGHLIWSPSPPDWDLQ